MRLITASDVEVVLGGRAVLQGVSLELQSGETVALIGPNGAGKTTLLRVLLGLLPYRGRVEVLGKPPERLTRAERQQIGYVPQALQFDRTTPLLTRELLWALLGERAQTHAQLHAILDAVDATHLLEKPVRTLSGGELQRVVIAAALAQQPKLLLLDEPATGIDVGVRLQFYELIERLRSEQAMGVLIVSHDLSVVNRYATRVVCIHHRLICTGSPEEILQMPILEELYGHPVGIYQHRHE
ncbi:MAG: zinc ABC transporter ATP-binding protein ZnuC [Armatimonadetes bacterium JP3_11]|nr:MAG: zinc ABC transporter ATP-binding protein ZnuC [Armatimonadetes bacterium JP3_11]OYT72828.1 MAG: zinc ABC transporter ATP-binding protein ZnuC [Armatimonadetes bacterium CP1_7O]RMH06146.1 MAG: metal ABC transporter ATP-binding protein [Armatimonadota bacterium]